MPVGARRVRQASVRHHMTFISHDEENIMNLKNYFYRGLALTIVLSLAGTEIRAADPGEKASYEYRTFYRQTAEESIFVVALNEYRVSRGLQPVTVSGELSNDCREWSSRMRQRGQLSHAPMVGMEICAQIAEESGMNALRAWQRSSAHNAILLSPRIDTIGIGSDGIWWTMRGTQRNAERQVHTVFRMIDAKTDGSDNPPGYRVPMGVADIRPY